MIIKKIPSAPGYLATSDGQIIGRSGCVLRGGMTPTGYCVVSLHCEARRVADYVHRFVLEAFVGPCPGGMQCRHLDGNPSNNRLGNLRWGTRQENEGDKIRHRTGSRGSGHGRAKLTERQVAKIRALYAAGDVTQGRLARRYGVTFSLISQIVRRKIWTHI